MSGELLPCPYCGGEEIPYVVKTETVVYIKGGNGGTSYDVVCLCQKCGAKTKGTFERALKEAIACAAGRWNARAERTCRNAEVSIKDVFTCSECGAMAPKRVLIAQRSEDQAKTMLDVPISYCPNCKAKVMDR